MSDTSEELKAADIMRVIVKTVPPTMLLPELETELLQEGVGGFPVVDRGRLVGVVSRTDVVRAICSEREVAQDTSDFYFDDRGFHESKMESLKDIADRVGERLEELRVADVMVGNPKTVAMDDPIREIARKFMDHHVHRLPVVENGGLVGIVTTMDLVKLVSNGRLTSTR